MTNERNKEGKKERNKGEKNNNGRNNNGRNNNMRNNNGRNKGETIYINRNVLPRKLEDELNNRLRLFPKEYKLLLKITQIQFLKLEKLKTTTTTNKKEMNELIKRIYEHQLLLNLILDINVTWRYLVMERGATVNNIKKYLESLKKDLSENNKKKIQNNNVIENRSGNITKYSSEQNAHTESSSNAARAERRNNETKPPK